MGFHRKETICLIFIIILAFFLNLIPHLNYPYVFHVDEWFHIARAKQIVLASKVDWYGGQDFSLGFERGWHLMLAAIYFIFKFDIPHWIYLPSILHSISIICVFIFVSRLYGKYEGLISSLLIALLPSNITMGGPVFLIPVNLSLIFIPLSLIFAFELTNLKKIYNYVFLIFLTTFLLYAHLPSAVVLLGVLGIYCLLNLFSNKDECKKKAKFLFVSMIISILVSLPNYLSSIYQKGTEVLTFNFWVELQGIPIVYGIFPTIFFIIGFYYLTKIENKENWSLILISIALLINILIFTMFGTNYILPYVRTHIPLFLIMSIIAIIGYTKLIEIKIPFK